MLWKSVRLVTTALILGIHVVESWLGKSCKFIAGILNSRENFGKRQSILFAVSEDQSPYGETKEESLEQEIDLPNHEDVSSTSSSYLPFDWAGGRPGLISFYNRPYKAEDEVPVSGPQRNNNLLWFIGPAVLVASFVFPSLYLRRILSTVFEDSLLTGMW